MKRNVRRMLLKTGGAILNQNPFRILGLINNLGMRTLDFEFREKGLLVTEDKYKKVLSRVGGTIFLK